MSKEKNVKSSLIWPAMQARQQRLDSLVSHVRSSRQRRGDLVNRFAFEMGLSVETVQEYVDVLISARILELGEDRMIQLVESK